MRKLLLGLILLYTAACTKEVIVEVPVTEYVDRIVEVDKIVERVVIDTVYVEVVDTVYVGTPVHMEPVDVSELDPLAIIESHPSASHLTRVFVPKTYGDYEVVGVRALILFNGQLTNTHFARDEEGYYFGYNEYEKPTSVELDIITNKQTYGNVVVGSVTTVEVEVGVGADFSDAWQYQGDKDLYNMYLGFQDRYHAITGTDINDVITVPLDQQQIYLLIANEPDVSWNGISFRYCDDDDVKIFMNAAELDEITKRILDGSWDSSFAAYAQANTHVVVDRQRAADFVWQRVFDHELSHDFLDLDHPRSNDDAATIMGNQSYPATLIDTDYQEMLYRNAWVEDWYLICNQ